MMLAIGAEEGLALVTSENSYMDCETKQLGTYAESHSEKSICEAKVF